MSRRRSLRRRGHYLLTFGVVQLLLGLLTVTAKRLPGPSREVLASLLPGPLYLGLSATVFVLCVAAVVLRSSRCERWAFTGLAGMAAWRATALAVAATLADGPLNGGMLSQSVVFLLVLRVHVLIAGWPEPQKVLVLDEDDWRNIASELRRRLEP